MSPALWGLLVWGALGASPLGDVSGPGIKPLPSAKVGSSRWMRVDPAERDAAVAAGVDRPIAQRLLEFSEGFVGTPYLASPLGEGEGVDPDPRIRFDAVDCLTFVEEAMAMSLARSADELLPRLDSVRYAKGRSYGERNHLMEADWLPANLRKGYLRELTAEVGGSDVIRATKKLSARTWASKTSLALALPKERQAVGELPLLLVPWEKLLVRAKSAPSGALLLVAREERELLPTRISHLGILVRRGDKLFLRHASRSLGRVLDEPLESFWTRHSRYGKWKVVGAAFFELTRPAL